MCQNNFILFAESFEEGSNTKETIYNNIEKLNDVNGQIKSFDDSVFKEDKIFSVTFMEDKQLYEILFLNHADFNQDYKTMLVEIINKAKNLNGENGQYIGLNKISSVYIINTIDELMQYYYNSLEVISSEEDFFACIKKYFQNLEFHDNVKTSLRTLKGGGLEFFSKDIIKSLKCLENEFKTILSDNNLDVRKSLVALSSTIGLETTIEGDIDRKLDFTFTFTKDDGTTINVCCEPHVKLSNSSKDGDNTHYFNRLHFHVGRDDIKKGNILIGSIGYHL